VTVTALGDGARRQYFIYSLHFDFTFTIRFAKFDKNSLQIDFVIFFSAAACLLRSYAHRSATTAEKLSHYFI